MSMQDRAELERLLAQTSGDISLVKQNVYPGFSGVHAAIDRLESTIKLLSQRAGIPATTSAHETSLVNLAEVP